MSIQQSIAQCKTPIDAGLDRFVYYSRRYNKVIKITRPGMDRSQCGKEAWLWQKQMTEAEREAMYFPVTEIMKNKRAPIIIMERCKPLRAAIRDKYDHSEIIDWVTDPCEASRVCTQRAKNIAAKYSLDWEHIVGLRKFLKRHCIHDTHLGNFGVWKDKLCVLDCGL